MTAKNPTKPELQRQSLRDLLCDAGQAMYGQRWQTPLAKSLGVSPRTVRRWVAGTTHVPATLEVILVAKLNDRSSGADAVAECLKKYRRGRS